MLHALQLLAEEATKASTDPLSLLLNWGPLGAIAVLLIIRDQTAAKRDRERVDKAEATVRELNDFIRTELLPKQAESTFVYKQVAEVLQDAINLISAIKYHQERTDVPPRGPRGNP